MNLADWKDAIRRAEEFARLATEAVEAYEAQDAFQQARHKAIAEQHTQWPPFPEKARGAGAKSAAAKRASMDLTRALVHVRHRRW